MKTFFVRTISAVIFAAIMLGGILWNEASFFLLFLVIGVLGMQEYFRLIQQIVPGYKNVSELHKICIILLLSACFLLASGRHFQFLYLNAYFIGIWLGLLLILVLFLSEMRGLSSGRKNLELSFYGLIYIALPLSLMIYLRWNYPVNDIAVIPLGLIFCLWINDTMAYIIGSLIGKTKFFPAISPKKTWEGTLGGIVMTVLAGAIYGYFGPFYDVFTWIMIAAITAIAGTAGDLLESKLKRLAGVKDSGNLMPGHGGVLDRFDSLLLATPFVWLFVVLFL